MQTIFESAFDIIYLITVISLGFAMVKRGKDNPFVRVYGIMAIVLGCGDAFHLVPRVYSLITDSLATNYVALGYGKLVTSLSMTVFYILLYHIFRMRYQVKNQAGLTITMYLLAALRVLLCLLPQNNWFSADSPVFWGMVRNIPFAIIGVIMIVLFQRKSKIDKDFKFMWCAITLSFAFYIPVVLWADQFPLIGMLMIPKTIAYVWIVWMGFKAKNDFLAFPMHAKSRKN